MIFIYFHGRQMVSQTTKNPWWYCSQRLFIQKKSLTFCLRHYKWAAPFWKRFTRQWFPIVLDQLSLPVESREWMLNLYSSLFAVESIYYCSQKRILALKKCHTWLKKWIRQMGETHERFCLSNLLCSELNIPVGKYIATFCSQSWQVLPHILKKLR